MENAGRIWTGLAIAGAIAAIAGKYCLVDRSRLVEPIIVDDRVLSYTRSGDAVLLAAGGAGLLRLTSGANDVETIMRFPGQVVAGVAASDNLIAVSAFKPGETQARVHLIDSGRAELMRTIELDGGGITIAGIHAGNRVIEIGSRVRFVDSTTGKVVGSVTIEAGILGGAHLVKNRLYVARARPGGLVVINAATMRVINVIATDDWLEEVTVVGNHALVVGNFGGYGLVDLTNRTYRRLDLQVASGKPGRALATSVGFAVVTTDSIVELDTNGATIRSHPMPREFLGSIHLGERVDVVDLTHDQATLSCGRRLVRMPVKR